MTRYLQRLTASEVQSIPPDWTLVWLNHWRGVSEKAVKLRTRENISGGYALLLSSKSTIVSSPDLNKRNKYNKNRNNNNGTWLRVWACWHDSSEWPNPALHKLRPNIVLECLVTGLLNENWNRNFDHIEIKYEAVSDRKVTFLATWALFLLLNPYTSN